jgi:hypothetical protein
MTIKIVGELEVDVERGVIYFHNYTNGCSTLRICGLKDKVAGFSHESQLDITIPAAIVMRSEMVGPVLKQPQGVFFLNEQHTTHVSKAQARRERAQVRLLEKQVLARADHLLKPAKKGRKS